MMDDEVYWPDLTPRAPSQQEEGTGAASSQQAPNRQDDDTSGSQPTGSRLSPPRPRRVLHEDRWGTRFPASPQLANPQAQAPSQQVYGPSSEVLNISGLVGDDILELD